MADLSDDEHLAILAGSPAVDRLPTAVGALGLGCAGVLMLGVQPLVLGALVTEGRLSIRQLTEAATIEMLALGVAAAALGAFAPHRRLRVWGVGGLILLCAANFGCLAASGGSLLMLRAAAGAAAGILIWIAAGFVARSAVAVRVSALFLGAQALTQAAFAAAIPSAAAALGANGGLFMLGAAAALALGLVFLLPQALPDLPPPPERAGRLSLPGFLGLTSSFLLMAGITGVWVLVEQVGLENGVSGAAISFAVAASLLTQVAGAAFVTWLGPRLPPALSVGLVCAGFTASVAGLALLRNESGFTIAVLLFGFLWNIGLSLSVSLLISADPSRRAALLLPGAQLLGGSAGPQITGAVLLGGSLKPALGVGMGLFAASTATIVLTILARTLPPPR